MGLTYNELLGRLEAVIEKKFSSKFDDLCAELTALKYTNSVILKLNNSLIEQNKILRSSAANSTDNLSSDDDDLDSESERTCNTPVAAPAEKASSASPASSKSHVDVLILSDSIFRHVGSACPKERDSRGLPIVSTFKLGRVDISEICVTWRALR